MIIGTLQENSSGIAASRFQGLWFKPEFGLLSIQSFCARAPCGKSVGFLEVVWFPPTSGKMLVGGLV